MIGQIEGPAVNVTTNQHYSGTFFSLHFYFREETYGSL
jgi:hypothetical protein